MFVEYCEDEYGVHKDKMIFKSLVFFVLKVWCVFVCVIGIGFCSVIFLYVEVEFVSYCNWIRISSLFACITPQLCVINKQGS